MSLYEEDASPGAASGGEPLSISIALYGSDSSQKEAETVRVGVVAVDVRTGTVVHDSFEESSGQRQELHTRLRHIRSANNARLELRANGLLFLLVYGPSTRSSNFHFEEHQHLQTTLEYSLFLPSPDTERTRNSEDPAQRSL